MSDEITNIEAGEAEALPARESQPEKTEHERPARTHEGQRGGDETPGESHERTRPSFQKTARFRRKSCRFCHDKSIKIDYKSYEMLEKFITDRGKILPRRITGTCAKHQRALSREIKRARIIALLPFVLQ
jgi:small subunit ribosomal protein S18